MRFMSQNAHHTQPQADSDDRSIPPMALWLGLLGLIPFIGLTALYALQMENRIGWTPGYARDVLVSYGAIILAFLGGIRWGVALKHGNSAHAVRMFILSVVVPLAAWVALFLPKPHDITWLIAIFLVVGVADVALVTKGHAPRWFGTLRTILTVGVVGCLITALALWPFLSIPA